MSLISLSSINSHNLKVEPPTVAGIDTTTFTTRELFDNERFQGFGMSPNGQSIIYIRDSVYGGDIYVSTDNGATFTKKTKPTSGYSGRYMYISNDGNYILLPQTGSGSIYISSDSGTNWTTKTITDIFFSNGAMSETGQYMALFGYHPTITANQGVYISTDYGANFTRTYSNSGPRGGCMSPNGKYLFVATNSTNRVDIVSSNYGQNWANCGSYPVTNNYTSSGCHISGNGKVLIKNSHTSFSETFISKNFGSTFTRLTTTIADKLLSTLYTGGNEFVFSINYDGSLIFCYIINGSGITLGVSKDNLDTLSIANSNIKTTNSGIVKGSKYGKYVLLNAKTDLNGNNKFLLTTFTNITELTTEPSI